MTRETGMETMQREPILDESPIEHFDTRKIKEQWAAFTAQLLEALPIDASLRQTLIAYAATPVSETLPQEFLAQAMATVTQETLRGILQKAQDTFGKYLEIPPIPLERIPSDITNSRGLEPEERDLIDTRFQMARFIKRLALGAELLENPDANFDGGGHLRLPSGISLVANPEKARLVSDVCDPAQWTGNKQIKDRVYTVDTKTRSYILKERKTRFHRHTKKGGHTDGLTSEQEFATARFLEVAKPKIWGNVQLSWEKPIGHVQYPDGYSFVVFEQEEDFIPLDMTMRSKQKIVALYAGEMERSQNPEYLEEYAAIERIANDIGLHSPDAIPLKLPRGERKPITLRDYFQAKASFDMEIGKLIHEEALIAQGFQNNDNDGLAYSVYPGNKKHPARLEVFAFDLEYYRPVIKHQDKPAFTKNHRARFFISEIEMLAHQEQTICGTLVYLALLQIHFPNEFEQACAIIKEQQPGRVINLSNIAP